jgi:hypothetical protein
MLAATLVLKSQVFPRRVYEISVKSCAGGSALTWGCRRNGHNSPSLDEEYA